MEIPARLKLRPIFAGLPIPYTTLVRDGKPDFRTNDIELWRDAATRRLCSQCGQSLDYYKWFIGGEKCLVERRDPDGVVYALTGVFVDLAMHEECARYAAAACPFLRGDRSEWSKREPPQGAEVDKLIGLPRRLGFFVTRDYRIVPGPRLLVKTSQITRVEWFWQAEGEAVK